MSNQRLVVSIVGISIFLNVLGLSENSWRQQLNQATNERQPSRELQRKVDELALRAKQQL